MKKITHALGLDGLRDCFREPIPEIFEAAKLLDTAVSAHLLGNSAAAEEAIRAADMPVIGEWIDSIWLGPWVEPYRALMKVSDLPPVLPKADRFIPRDAPQAMKRALVARDGHHCRLCGIPLVRAAVRKKLNQLYPSAARWTGVRAAEQHRGLQVMWLQYDHVVVHSRGGETSMNNLVVTCPACNFGRDRFMLEEVRLRDPRSHIRRPTWEGWSTWEGIERVLPQREQFVLDQSERGDNSRAIDAPITLAGLQTSDGEESTSADQLPAPTIVDLHDQSGAASEVERIVLAFEDQPPTLAEHKLIQTLLDHPNSTCAEMSAWHGWQENAWDMQYGRMCAKRLGVLQPVQPAKRMKLEPKIALLTTIVRNNDGMLRYTTKHEAVEAFKQIGYRVEASNW